MSAFNITLEKNPSQCAAKRCSQTASHQVGGEPWGKHGEVPLCKEHHDRYSGVDKKEFAEKNYKVVAKIPDISGPVPLPPPELDGCEVYWDRQQKHWRFVHPKDKRISMSAAEAYAKYGGEIRVLK